MPVEIFTKEHMSKTLNHFDHSVEYLLHKQRVALPLTIQDQNALLAYYLRLEDVFAKQLASPEHEDNADSNAAHGGYWTNVSLSNGEFIRQLGNIEKNHFPDRGAKFLDVGCGFGQKCWLASRRGWNATGIDFCNKYIKLAKQIFENSSISDSFTCIDALDYKSYGDFDLVYVYQPIRDTNKMSKLLSIIEEQMKLGSFFYIRKFFDYTFNTLDGVPGGTDLYKKVR